MKRELARLIALLLCLGICSFPAQAAATGGVTEEDGDISIPIGPDTGKEDPPEAYVAQGFCGDEAMWILNDQGLLLISGDGAMFDYETPGSAPWYDYRDEIKEVMVDGDVSPITAGAFYDCANLETVSLGNGVTAVDGAAFVGCAALKRILADSDNAALTNDAAGALYSKDKSVLVRCPTGYSGYYLIPETVTAVEEYAFADCTALTGVTIQEKVVRIGEGAFSGCSALEKVRYCASREQWEQIVIGSQNEPLTGAQIQYDAQPYIPGDFDTNGQVTDADALYLLRNTLFPDRYPIEQPGDVNGDNEVSDADALYLLRHTLFPSRYPLN